MKLKSWKTWRQFQETASRLWAGNRKGQYSIRINDQWRICFRWQEGAAEDVEIVDYH